MVKPTELPTFDGNPLKATNWLKQYERAANENFYTSDLIVRSVSCCLQGDAERWYELKYLRKRTDSTWETFRKMFKESYMKPVDRTVLFNRIVNRRQRYDESLSSYYREILQLCLEYDEGMKEEEILQWICKNLHPRHASAVSLALCVNPTLDFLSSLAEISEALANIGIEKVNISKVRVRNPSELVQRRERESHRTVTAPSTVVCYNCLSKGHYSSQCTKPRDSVRISENAKRFKDQRNIATVEPETSTALVPYETVNIELPNSPLDSPWKIVDALMTESNVNRVQMPSIEAFIHGYDQIALVDSGARCSLMAESFQKKIGLDVTPCTHGPLRMANQQKEAPVGMSKCKVLINKMIIPCEFLIMFYSEVISVWNIK